MKHRFVLSYVWELPFGEGRKFANGGPLKPILENWQFGGIVTLSTGLEVEYRRLPREEYFALVKEFANRTDDELTANYAAALLGVAECIVRPEMTVETKGGDFYSGILLGQQADGTYTLLMSDGRGAVVPGALVKSHEISKVSLMPDELEQGLTVEEFRDLVAFMLSLK